MKVLPKARRNAIYAFYAFCREVDDIADDSPNEQMRDEGLAMWHRKIAGLFQKDEAEDSLCAALLPAIKDYKLVEEDFQAIISGMEMDAQAPIVAPNMKTLDLYCDLVASAVGRVSVRIFGDSSPAAMQVAYHLGRALQLTNILRDIMEDAGRGRLYLPLELLNKYGIKRQSIEDVLKHPALPDVCRDLAQTAKNHFSETDRYLPSCNKRAMRPARVMRNYYKAIWNALVNRDWKHMDKRIKISSLQKFWLTARGLIG
jgi:phytoene synthase